ncbi:MAG: nucleoside-diphosphate sugar epimerase/dehydratase, partial [Bacteroidota bacterium]
MKRVTAIKFLSDLLVWGALAPIAFALRLEGDIMGYGVPLVVYTSVALVVKVIALWASGLHFRPWRWVSVRDVGRLLVTVAAVTLILWVVVLIAYEQTSVPRSVPLIESALAVLALSGLRMASRLRNERARRPKSDGRRVLVAGAGEAAMSVVRELLRYPEKGINPVAFLDDKEWKWKQLHLGRPVVGPLVVLEDAVAEHDIDEVLIAMPSAPGSVIRGVVEAAQRAGVPSRTVPSISELASGDVEILQFREIDLEDLLRRETVEIDAAPVRDYVAGRRVLVTGAGGSIGSEIVRQIATFRPASLTLVGRGENSVFLIDRELGRRWSDVDREAVICDVRDRRSLRAVFERVQPEVVFHAAAHKHVPLMEANPEQAILNNVVGTRNVAELSAEFGVRRLVNVSTDKAVNPTNVMGASKRVAEHVVSAASEGNDCVMASVRFGNVLGSRGSVVPLFREQIKRGGPVTVTHPDMVRYFMTIPEAAQLVLQAGALEEDGRVYVLDMGKPVKIADLARDLIRLSGLEPGVDIEITYTGARPGEKLYEELLLAEEGTEPSPHEKIFVARKVAPAPDFAAALDALIKAAEVGDGARIRMALQRAVPTYHPEAAAPIGSGRGDGAMTPPA